jgi:uncharacterized protein YjiS (DUF1127 family)
MAMTIDGVHAGRERKSGVFARALERMAAAQMDRGRAIAKPYLLSLDDEELSDLGYRREEIQRWPSGAARWL